MIRDFMPDEHRELFEKLPYLVVGAADDAGRLWASFLVGEPGFVRTPDERTLQVSARPPAADPMRELLVVGRPVGLLGIELATRRRNRANGELVAADGAGFAVQIRQSFGNCPQYIQARRPLEAAPRAAERAPRMQGPRLDDEAAAVIRGADTFFLASATPGEPRAPADGVDVSHRGGRPGFVAVEQGAAGTELVAPDYRGNFMFNTVGNLELNPRAGLLFLDFASGAMLSLTGEAEISWDDPRIAELPGAQRLLRVRVTGGVLLLGALPWRWSEPELAPQLSR